MEVSIELCTAADLPRVVAIANWAAEHTTANFATQPEPVEEWQRAFEQTEARFPWLVARLDGQVLGFAKGSPHKARGAYAWAAEVSVYVDGQHHARGIGKKLYQHLIPILRAQGFKTLIAGITVPNPASEKLHQSFGFVRCALFPKVGWKFGAWRDVGYFTLELDTPEPPPPTRLVAPVWAAQPWLPSHP